ncbi:hypothetical protein [Caballeronia sp. AZ7_KS35]|uniref:hypothetical protein n=1 Tax=Caballeronia sp. AZ7_KS35 TaxID=2921762 RepID=UPI0020294466|nr:hypothetical protein [Caballeronia sp. AZ7_KS35]
MEQSDKRCDEAAAVARIAEAAREVQSASVALEAHFKKQKAGVAPTLQLARLAAAMQELESARDALDVMLDPSGRPKARHRVDLTDGN